MEPSLEIHVVPYAPAYLLGGMDMGVHESGKHIFATEVDDLGIWRNESGIYDAHSLDEIVLYQDRSSVIDLVVLVHRKDISVFQQYLMH
jgi:hypothetical protein